MLENIVDLSSQFTKINHSTWFTQGQAISDLMDLVVMLITAVKIFLHESQNLSHLLQAGDKTQISKGITVNVSTTSLPFTIHGKIVSLLSILSHHNM